MVLDSMIGGAFENNGKEGSGICRKERREELEEGEGGRVRGRRATDRASEEEEMGACQSNSTKILIESRT